MLKGPYGPTLADCKANWKAYSDDAKKMVTCLEGLLFGSVTQLLSPEGMPAIGLDNMTPVKLDVVQSQDLPLFSINYKNVSVYGILEHLKPGNCIITHDPVTKISTATTNMPYWNLEGDFELKVKVGNVIGGLSGLGDLPITGRSPVKFYRNMNVVKIHWKERKTGGLAVTKVESNTDFEEITFDPVFTSPLGMLVGPFVRPFFDMKEITHPLSRGLLMPLVDRELARIVGTVLHKGWPRLEKLK